jgi:FAD/FMN-containing dehydrogenase
VDAGVNWAGNIRYSARELHRPASIEELRRIVSASRGLRALGSRHSFSGIADTPGDLVETTSLPRRLDIDSDAAAATISAGTRYGEFAPELDRAGWAISNMGSLPHITVGGAIATGTHGSSDVTGTLAGQVRGLEIRFEMRQDIYSSFSWSTMLEHLDEITASAYSVALHTRFTGETFGSAWLKAIGELPPELLGARPVVPEQVVDESLDAGTRKGGVPGPWQERLPHFKLGFTPSHGDELQSEYFVPRPQAAESLEALHRIGERIEPHLHVSEIRTVAAEDLWLSGSEGRDVLSIGFTWRNHPREVEALLPVVEDLLLPLGARPHWGKRFFTRELDALYPRLDDFRTLADRWDPRGKLRNRWLDRRIFS